MQQFGVISPSLDEFRALAASHRVVPVTVKVLADDVTPITLYRKLGGGQAGTFLLESAAVGGVWSRYSFVGTHSRAVLTTRDGQALGVTLLSSDMGKLYVALAQAIERLRD